MHGHVVIARHDDLGRGKLVEIAARRGEFPAPGALRQITGNHDDIRLGVTDGARESGQHGIVQPAEMQVREMGKDAQAGSLTLGACGRGARQSGRNDDAQRAGADAIMERGLQRHHLAVGGDA